MGPVDRNRCEDQKGLGNESTVYSDEGLLARNKSKSSLTTLDIPPTANRGCQDIIATPLLFDIY